ncbi:MAG TPA: BON domain-containing protein [Bryobacteraceae bacterium]|jgi:hyperosmotically inducible periplasmic protein|nr:BON domain-containing protein [Bryobacteraceae bacterium]
MKPLKKGMRWGLVALMLAAPVLVQATSPSVPPTLEQRVHHELAMLPYYNVFDNLEFTVSGDSVTLAGAVTDPVLKSDAGNVVKRIAGVKTVTNEIEVLPLSPMDWQIRRAEVRAIYRYAALGRYAMGAVPSIHIIVKNGHVTLDGVVDSEMDRNLAGIRANGVSNVFSVTNRLVVGKS